MKTVAYNFNNIKKITKKKRLSANRQSKYSENVSMST